MFTIDKDNAYQHHVIIYICFFLDVVDCKSMVKPWLYHGFGC